MVSWDREGIQESRKGMKWGPEPKMFWRRPFWQDRKPGAAREAYGRTQSIAGYGKAEKMWVTTLKTRQGTV